MAGRPHRHHGARRTQEALGRRDDILEAAGYAAERFLQTADWTDCIDEVLERLGRAGAASRAFVSRIDADAQPGSSPKVIHEWGDPLVRLDPHPAPANGVPAPLEVAVTVDGEAWGSIGFVAGQERDWQTAEIDAVRVIANTLGAAVGRQRAAQRLHEAESRYRRLIETIPAATYIDTVDAISQAIYMSPQVERIYGYTPEEWRSRPSLWEEGLHPDDRDEVVARVERHNREGVPYEAEYRFRHRDGRWVWVHDEAVMILDEDGAPRLSQGVIFDITPLKHHEEQLRDTEERFRGIVEHVPSAIYLDSAGPGMESLYISPQIQRIAGVSPEEWLADPELWLRLMHPDDRDAVRDSYVAAAAAGRAWSAEYRMQTRDGRTIWVHDETTFLHDEEGNATFIQGVISDITERRLAEQALRESEQREREAAERLRALDEMKNTFLAAVSHELRSPLTSILGLSLTLERTPELDDERPRGSAGAPVRERTQARPAPQGPAGHRPAEPRHRGAAVPNRGRGRARPAHGREPGAAGRHAR